MTNKQALAVLQSKTSDWRTPVEIFEWLDSFVHYTLDAAASHEAHVCDRYFTEKEDGLKQPWLDLDGKPAKVFVNPPYGIGPGGKSLQHPWFKKAHEEAMRNGTVSTLLVPPRTDTTSWHEEVSQALEIWFLRGRISFLNATGTARLQNTTPSVLVVFGPKYGPGPCGGPRVRFVVTPSRVRLAQ